MTLSPKTPRAAPPQQLVRAAARKSGLPADLISEAFEALIAAVCDTLLRGQPVELGPVGTLRPVLTRAGQPKLAISPPRRSKLLHSAAPQSGPKPRPSPKPRAPPAATAPARQRRGLRRELVTQDGLTEKVLREQLSQLDFSNVRRGATIHLWSQSLSSKLGYCGLPVIDVIVPLFPNKRAASEQDETVGSDEIVDIIIEKLIEPLDREIEDDVITFYSMVTGLVSTDDFDAQKRSSLVRRFENGESIPPLPLMRVGNGDLPVASSFHQSKVAGSGAKRGMFELRWTN